jgi:hypothetical protein
MIIGPEMCGVCKIHSPRDEINRLVQSVLASNQNRCNRPAGTFDLITALLRWYWDIFTVETL